MAILVLLLVGCSGGPAIETAKIKEYQDRNLEIVGDKLTSDQIATIKTALGYLPENFRKSVLVIHLRDDLDHFSYHYLDKTKTAAAHNCTAKGRKVCIRPEHLKNNLIWHEVAHVYTHCNPEASNFIYDWIRVAGDVYADDYESYYSKDPDGGLLTNYSRCNYLEDIAEWVQCCYTYLYLDKNYWVFNNKYLKSDSRYRKKLALLYKYGFLDESGYKKLKPLFE